VTNYYKAALARGGASPGEESKFAQAAVT
jgi:hypothetical protein